MEKQNSTREKDETNTDRTNKYRKIDRQGSSDLISGKSRKEKTENYQKKMIFFQRTGRYYLSISSSTLG